MRRFVLTLPSYALALLLLYIGAWLNLFPIARAHSIGVVIAGGLGIFGGLIWSGRTLRWRDPLAVLPQVLFSVVVIALSYHLIEISRGVAFMWLAVIVVFDMRRLPMKQVRFVIAAATVLQLANSISIWVSHPNGPKLIDELLNLGCLALLLPTLVMVSNHARTLVKRRKQQNVEREKALQTLHFLSVHDTLTGLYNRRHMLACLDQEARKTARFGVPFTVGMLDIDFFKRVNDQHGHAVGDAVLKRFSEIASSVFEPFETVARWGGEEFVVLMPKANGHSAYRRLQDLQAAIHRHDWNAVHPGLRITFSAGLATYRDGAVEDLMDLADQALYEAKHAGRDRISPEFVNVDAHSPRGEDHAASRERAQASLPGRGPLPALTPAAASMGMSSTKAKKPLDRSASHATSSSLSKLLWTDDPKTRTYLKLASAVSGMYVFWLLVVIFYAIPKHMFPRWLELVLLGHLTIGAVAPLAIIRSGWSKRFKDPIFLMEQCIWANLMLVAAHFFSPIGKGALLGVLCQVQAFGFPSFSPRQARNSGTAVFVMLVISLIGMSWWGGPEFDAASEGLSMATACAVLLMLTWQSYNYARSREKNHQERQELELAIAEVERLTTIDTLTGLYNRQHLHQVLDHETMRSGVGSPGFCVALIDLDHFKQVNDVHGHQAGDEVLAGFAALAKTAFRDTDTVGRWGGEEFLIIMPGGSQMPIDRLLVAVAQATLSNQASELRVTFSAGLAHHRVGESWADTLERADRALYAAKQAGRNQCIADI
ncbi:MAG: GGDEF domain-containing protein [Rubrivivax sp.]|nr:MAG: GGDEF domain-containing protein [Rubrivivax sp.]